MFDEGDLCLVNKQPNFCLQKLEWVCQCHFTQGVQLASLRLYNGCAV